MRDYDANIEECRLFLNELAKDPTAETVKLAHRNFLPLDPDHVLNAFATHFPGIVDDFRSNTYTVEDFQQCITDVNAAIAARA